MLKKISGFLFSTRLMAMAILAFAVAMATATFIENDYGTPTAKAVIYNTWWFEVIMVLLVVNFIANMFRYRLFRREKWPVLLFHLAFIVTLLGAFITRYHGFEGMLSVREGELSNKMFSDNTHINIRVDNGKLMKNYDDSVLFGQIGNNKYFLKSKFGEDKKSSTPFSIELIDFVGNAKDSLLVDPSGDYYLHIVETSSGSRRDLYVKDGEIKSINGILFSFNNFVKGGMNFTKKGDETFLQPLFEGSYMEMQTQKLTPVIKDSLAPLQIKKLYTFKNMRFVIKAITKGVFLREATPRKMHDQYPHNFLTFKIKSGKEEEIVSVKGRKFEIRKPIKTSLNGLNFHISYGSKYLEIPFSIKLKKFELERYPGTDSPSSYASEVTVIDKDKTFDFRIYMNHVLDFKGYRFFQSSFDPDEKGTHLSVNHDYWGTLVTYIGYILMGIGMFFTLFWNGSRFKDLSNKLKKTATKKTTIILLFLSFGLANFAQEEHTHNEIISSKTSEELQKHVVSKAHADKLGKLLIQDFGGRFKPVNTYALEALRKVYGKDKYKGLTAEQVLISAQLNPMLWDNEPIIKVNTIPLGKEIVKHLKVENEHASLASFFQDRTYYLKDKVATAFQKNSVLRTKTDKEIINLDEKVNIWSSLLNGSLMRIYPKKGDANNKWFIGIDREAFIEQDTMILKLHSMYMRSLIHGIETNDYKEADNYLKIISEYQQNLSAEIIPSQKRIELEIKYNRWNVFLKLLLFYFTIGMFLIVLAFFDLFKPNAKVIKLAIKILTLITILGVIAHGLGLSARWYILERAPWSNGYEATVFIAFITVLVGFIFSYNRSKFIIAVSVLFAGFLLGIAHGSLMSPEMTNLVPVLKSYWLIIHVAIITASYAFLGLASLLGFIVLLLFILRTPANKNRLNETIKELTYVNESTLIVGLFMLTIGTFLGGVWANESWGRYWSWDPKEVWALISMMVYIFILHMRMVPGLQSRFAFNFASMISIATLIMTYFGVNYYLSGMHSYATGDPVPFPSWGIVAIVFIAIFSIFSFFRYRNFKARKK